MPDATQETDEHPLQLITGRTLSPDLPTRRPVQDRLRDEDYDVLVAVIK